MAYILRATMIHAKSLFGLLDGIMGNATKVSNDSVRLEEEVIEHSYKLV